MKRGIVGFLAAVLLSGTAMAHGHEHDHDNGVISIAKAVELGAHRIERLVVLKKIDPTFRTALINLTAERTSQMGARFKIVAVVSPDAQKKSSTIAILVDQKGKVLSYKVGEMAKPLDPTIWPEKDALSLIENSLHFVLDGVAQNPDLKPFNDGLLSIALTPGKDADGKMVALSTLTSDDDTRSLLITLETNGNVLSHEIK